MRKCKENGKKTEHTHTHIKNIWNSLVKFVGKKYKNIVKMIQVCAILNLMKTDGKFILNVHIKCIRMNTLTKEIPLEMDHFKWWNATERA